MPSSRKTPNLRLNDWLGSDKPKRDDFNEDNRIIDQWSREAGAHAADAGIHVTQAEKDAWGAGGEPVIGTYLGNGNASRKIELGFEPKAGFVFAVSDSMVWADFSRQEFSVLASFFTSQGAGGGVSVQSDGFTVTHNFNVTMQGFAYRLNNSGAPYVYVVWR